VVDREEGGRFFRVAWIEGVNTYYPGIPKPGYIAAWEDISDWEKESVMDIYPQVHALILAGAQQEPFSHLTREQGDA
jgi:hypothetical protein